MYSLLSIWCGIYPSVEIVFQYVVTVSLRHGCFCEWGEGGRVNIFKIFSVFVPFGLIAKCSVINYFILIDVDVCGHAN